MSPARPEFSRIIPLTRLDHGDTLRQRIAASEAERAALARRFELVALCRLEAEIALSREAGGTVLMQATFEAEFAQRCIVTLDPVIGQAGESFQLRYGRPEAEAEVPDGDGDPAFEPLAGDAIDIGEAVAQEFSLALPPFPRAPGAAVETEPPEAPVEGPFAVLRRLIRRDPA
jgi:uncharacterized metal-binding protein YceD (DUF177 family)